MKFLHQGMLYSPDESGTGRGSRSATAEVEESKGEAEDQGPKLFRVGDEEVPEEELIRSYKGTKETTRRFQEVSEREKRAQAAEERATRLLQEAEERERRLNATRDELLTVRPKDTDGTPRRPGLRERLKEVDFVTSDNAGEKVGELFEDEWEARQAEMRAEHDRQLKQLRLEVKAELDRTKAEVTSASTQITAADRIRRQNKEIFQKVLEEEFGGLNLSKAEIAEAEDLYSQHIGRKYGSWDASAGAWSSSELAAKHAIRSVDSVLDRLVATKTAKARGDGLQARERGERATESTPGRTARPGSTDPDQALLQKHHDLSEAIRERRITEEQARRALSFKEQKRLVELRNVARDRARVEAAD